MPGTVQIIATVVLVVVVAVLVTFAFRLTRWLFHARRILAFQVASGDLARRAERGLARISERVDEVRRGARTGAEIAAELAQAKVDTDGLVAKGRQLRAPAEAAAIATGIVAELERAGRAIEMIDHGCRLVGVGSRRDQNPEAQTSIKRGYLNLLHAREAIAEQASAAATMRIPGPHVLARRVVREDREPPP
jgi:hypothetical protein